MLSRLGLLPQGILIILSFVLVAFGQPAWSGLFSFFSALFGYALFWRILLCYSEKKHRFWIATSWFTGVQLVQLSWLTGHPFLYIYLVYFALSVVLGFQFGVLGLFFSPKKITQIRHIFFLASLWTLMEWMRLYWLSGFSFNPVGLALAGNLFSLQTAALLGAYGLSFLVILINLLALRAFLLRWSAHALALWAVIALFPYLFGSAHYYYHQARMSRQEKEQPSLFSVLLVQTAFPVVEESLSPEQWFHAALKKWEHIAHLTEKHAEKSVQLILLPEFVVPFSAYSFIFPYEKVKETFQNIFGPESLHALPSLTFPLAYQQERWMVNHAFWSQALANLFDAGVVIGLEDIEEHLGKREYYSSALYIKPESQRDRTSFSPLRYDKRVLVPMGEYIPFTFCRDLCVRYGVMGSFTCGKTAHVWHCGEVPMGVSICYEETFGDMMRENRKMGAKVLLNLTSDAWFPNSRLIRQHLEHARLRTVENGIPLIRACNTGITCAIDSLGREVATLGDDDKTCEWISDALHVEVPLYTYQTLYSRFGDGLIVGVSLLISLLFFRQKY